MLLSIKDAKYLHAFCFDKDDSLLLQDFEWFVDENLNCSGNEVTYSGFLLLCYIFHFVTMK